MLMPAQTSRQVKSLSSGRENRTRARAAKAKRTPTKKKGPVASRALRMMMKVAPRSW